MSPTATDARAAYGSLSAAESAALDAAAVELGGDISTLMEIAGWQVARCAWGLLESRPRPVAVLAGRGNNGGDGAVAARHLSAWGCDVSLHVIATPDTVGDILAAQVQRATAAGVTVRVDARSGSHRARINAAALVIDALLGTGLESHPRPPIDMVIRATSGRPVLSVDVPSGLDATTGEAYTPCVRATATCTLGAVKCGLWTEQGRERAGELWVADIGMPRTAWARAGLRPPTALTGGTLTRVPPGSGAPPEG